MAFHIKHVCLHLKLTTRDQHAMGAGMRCKLHQPLGLQPMPHMNHGDFLYCIYHQID